MNTVLLSDHFTLGEMTKSTTAVRAGIPNEPDDQQIESMKALCANVLEAIRDHFGPVRVLSGLRVLPLNFLVGGAKNSQHMAGEAADVEVVGTTMLDLFNWIRVNVKIDQCALEFVDQNKPGSGWVHVSYGPRMRGEFLVIDHSGTRLWTE